MRTQISEYEYNPFTTSSQVKTILHSKGFSHLFNWNDYEHFKRITKGTFNQAQEIAQQFINEADSESELTHYPF